MVEFHQVSSAHQLKYVRSKRKGPHHSNVGLHVNTSNINFLMQVPAFNRQSILKPNLLKMNERALSLAEQQVLQP